MGLTALLSACAALPSSGPSTIDVERQVAAPDDLGGYILIRLDERVASICAQRPADSLVRVFNDGRPAPDIRIGVGDTVEVTIWEAGAGGLFSSVANSTAPSAAGSRTATMPQQVVTRDGRITIPYAGRLKVAGLTPAEVETEIVKRLTGKAIEPQAVVTVAHNLSNKVTVTGEVTAGAVVPLSVKGDRILDVIATTGGLRAPAYESMVRLTRNGTTASIAFNAILANPRENIFVRPGDVISVIRKPQTFTAFGSTGRNASYEFDSVGISLEEAIAKAGGLLDSRADPGGVFLLRFEPVDLVKQLVPERALPSGGNLIPVVYQLNLRELNSFFLARSMEIKSKDILYISNSPSDQVSKFFSLIGNLTSPAIAGLRIGNGL